MGIFLGIDGGGIGTRCVLGDEDSVLGSAVAGGSNPVRFEEAVVRENLSQVVLDACDSVGVQPSAVQFVHAGIAGAAAAEPADRIRRILAELLPEATAHITGDMIPAMHNAFGGLPGVVIMAGTGSIAYGRDQQNREARAGGWGPAISDEGSGYWIGRTAVSKVLSARDSGLQTALTAACLDALGLTSMPELVLRANATPPLDFASLFPVVLACADQNDAVARNLLLEAGAHLARLCASVMRTLWPPEAAVRVAIGGGVFANSALVRQALLEQLRSQCPNACISFRIVDPAQGALALARRTALASANHTPKPAWA